MSRPSDSHSRRAVRFEDGSVLLPDGRVYDPDTGRVRPATVADALSRRRRRYRDAHERQGR